MEIMLRNILLLFAILTECTVYSQFNTLIRGNDNTDKIIEKLAAESNPQPKVLEKNNYRRTSKKDILHKMQVELDSLKKTMYLNQDYHNKIQYFDVKKLQDSIINILKKAVTNSNNNKSSEFNKTNFFAKNLEMNFKSQIYSPLKGRLQVSSHFGPRYHPIFNRKKMHNGTDLKANYENVTAILDGVVLQSGWDSKGGGSYIKIKHNSSYVTSYLHLSERYFNVGDFVKAGSTIALSGNSGNSTGPHLHFSVEKNGSYIDPISFLNDLFIARNLIATYYEN